MAGIQGVVAEDSARIRAGSGSTPSAAGVSPSPVLRRRP
jgi:hypothetical protein